jgi:hypothetical protein
METGRSGSGEISRRLSNRPARIPQLRVAIMANRLILRIQ